MPTSIEPAPTVFGTTPLPHRTPVLRLTVRFERSDIILSTALFDHLKLQAHRRLVFVESGGIWYLTRDDTSVLQCSVLYRGEAIRSVTIHHRPFCEQLRRVWGCAPDEVRGFFVSNHPFVVPGLDLIRYPHPVYRLIADSAVRSDSRLHP